MAVAGPGLAEADAAALERAVDALAFPRFVALHSAHFDLGQCEFTPDGSSSGAPAAPEDEAAAPALSAEADKEGSARVALARATGLHLAFTLEMHYACGKAAFATPPASNDGGRATPPAGGGRSSGGGGGGRSGFGR